MPLGTVVSLDPSDIVSDGDPAPPPQKGTEPPIFGACLLWPNSCMDQDATWYACRPRPMAHCARCEPNSPSTKRGHSPLFSVHVYCGQTAAWIKMPLGMELGLDPSDIVLDADPAPPAPKGGRAPNFRSMSIVAKQLHGLRCHLKCR